MKLGSACSGAAGDDHPRGGRRRRARTTPRPSARHRSLPSPATTGPPIRWRTSSSARSSRCSPASVPACTTRRSTKTQLQAFVRQELSEIIDSERVPLSGRGASAARPTRSATTSSATARSSRFLDDDTVTEIMVNAGSADLRRARRPPQPHRRRRFVSDDHLRRDHRTHRGAGRPPHRRVVADGRRPPARRLARQRHHPAAGGRRADR